MVIIDCALSLSLSLSLSVQLLPVQGEETTRLGETAIPGHTQLGAILPTKVQLEWSSSEHL